MNVRSLICGVFGHQPHEYQYENVTTTTYYHECARCDKRKILKERGWD